MRVGADAFVGERVPDGSFYFLGLVGSENSAQGKRGSCTGHRSGDGKGLKTPEQRTEQTGWRAARS